MTILKNLTDLSHKRNFFEAVLFYFLSLCLIVAVSGTLTAIFGIFTQSNSLMEATIVSSVITFILNMALSILILKAKNLTGDFVLFLLAIFSGLLTIIGGSLLGLLIVAYFSTLKVNKK